MESVFDEHEPAVIRRVFAKQIFRLRGRQSLAGRSCMEGAPGRLRARRHRVRAQPDLEEERFARTVLVHRIRPGLVL
jgi:hypothetical protein